MRKHETWSGGRTGRWLWLATIVVAILGTLSVFGFQYMDRFLPMRAVAATGDRLKHSDTPFHDHVTRSGVSSCSHDFPSMGTLLTQNSQYMVQTNWNKQEPDLHILRALVGMRFDTPDYKGPAIGVMLSAPMKNSCETNAVRITPFDMSCEEVVRRFLPGGAVDTRLQDLPIYRVADGSQVVTMPIGKSCIAVSVAYSAGGSKNAQ